MYIYIYIYISISIYVYIYIPSVQEATLSASMEVATEFKQIYMYIYTHIYKSHIYTVSPGGDVCGVDGGGHEI